MNLAWGWPKGSSFGHEMSSIFQSPFVACFGKWIIDSNNLYTYLFALFKLCTPSLSKVANHTYYYDANLNT